MASWIDRLDAWLQSPARRVAEDFSKLIFWAVVTFIGLFVVAHFVIKYW